MNNDVKWIYLLSAVSTDGAGGIRSAQCFCSGSFTG